MMISHKSITAIQQEIIEEFSVFDDWMGRYEYIIEFGKSLPSIAEEYKTDTYLVRGCQAKVWLHSGIKEGNIVYTADSDAIITKGLVGLMVHVLSGHTPEEIVNTGLYFIDKTGLKEHLSPNRSNGLVSMVKQMKLDALAFIERGKIPPDNGMNTDILKNAIIDILQTCYDPEIPVDIYRLGLIYDIKIDEEKNAEVIMTLTSPNCPVAESLPTDVEQKIKSISGLHSAKVTLTFDPPWTMEKMSEEAKLELGML